MDSFPYYELSGDPEQLGSQAGNQYSQLIKKNYDFYQEFFAELLKIDTQNKLKCSNFQNELEKLSIYFGANIQKHFPDFDAEISAMATAAKIDKWKIYLLNSRTEIYRKLMNQKATNTDPGECTSLYFPDSLLLGQNWDWHPKLEELTIITKVSPTKDFSFVTMTEPGILGKIGVNSEGLGVCLNILFANCEISGIPIHILLRAVLQSKTISEASSIIENIPRGTSSNLLMADKSGNAVNLELKGTEIISYNLSNTELIHTNHYLAEENSASATLPGSTHRLSRAKELYSKYSKEKLAGMKLVLTDKENSDFPICRSYSMGLDFMVGTVASIILDLKNSELHIHKGQAKADSIWKVYKAAQ